MNLNLKINIMKKSNLIFAVIIAIITLSSCTKQDGPNPLGTNPPQPQIPFTGVVFSQVKSDVYNTIYFRVRNFQGTIDTTYYLCNNDSILSDTIPLNAGDLIEISAYKTTDPGLQSQDIQDYEINIKVYLNGVKFKDENQNYFNPNYPIQF